MQTRKTRTFIYHENPGHGWIEVPMQELYTLGIAAKITPYSYRNGETAFLEEDDDADTLLKALRAQGVEVTFERRYQEYTPIRHYNPYWCVR